MKSLHNRLEKQRAAAREAPCKATQCIAKRETLRRQRERWNVANQIVDNKSLDDAAMNCAKRRAEQWFLLEQIEPFLVQLPGNTE